MNAPQACSAVVIAALTAVTAGCGRSPAPARELVTVTRPAGSWQGRGNSTLGFVSDSGRLRITWQARAEASSGSGSLRVTVHSAVSGRPLKVVVDHHGDGGGEVSFDDDPRAYNLMVESANVEWSIRVDEFVGVYQDLPPASPARPH